MVALRRRLGFLTTLDYSGGASVLRNDWSTNVSSKMACSFTKQPDRSIMNGRRLSEYARPLANVILGTSESKQDIGIALRYMSHQLVPLTSTVEFAVSLSDAVLERGKSASSFPVHKSSITQMFTHAYTVLFGGCDLSNIGNAYASSMQRLVYNTAACTVASLVSYNRPDRNSYVRNCTLLLVELASAVKQWLVNDEWLRGWSGCHALLSCIELTEKSVLSDRSAIHSDTFIRFADTLFERVCLENRHLIDSTNVADFTNSFGWCAFSRSWRPFIYNKMAQKLSLSWTNKLARKIDSALDEAYYCSLATDRETANNECHSRPSSPKTPRHESSPSPSPIRVPLKTISKSRKRGCSCLKGECDRVAKAIKYLP